MKKVIALILVAVVMISAIAVTAYSAGANVGYYVRNTHGTRYYPAAMVVVGIEEVGNGTDEVAIKGCNGNVFKFFSDAGDWFEGAIVAVIMDNNGTVKVQDDAVIAAGYAGYGNPDTW